jgi:hypothetical protein
MEKRFAAYSAIPLLDPAKPALASRRWGTRFCAEFVDELAELSTAAVAEAEDLDTKMPGGPLLAHDAVDTEAEAVNLEAHLELVADDVACAFAGVDEAAVETEIEDAAFAQIPVVDPEFDGSVAGVTGAAAAVSVHVSGVCNGRFSADVRFTPGSVRCYRLGRGEHEAERRKSAREERTFRLFALPCVALSGILLERRARDA